MYNFNKKSTHNTDAAEGSCATNSDEPIQLPTVDVQDVDVDAELRRHAEEDDDDNENEYAYDPTYQAEEVHEAAEDDEGEDGAVHDTVHDEPPKPVHQQQALQQKPERSRPQKLKKQPVQKQVHRIYNTSGAMNRFQAQRGATIIDAYEPPAPNAAIESVLGFFRTFMIEHNVTPPKPWREIRFELPSTVPELQLEPPRLEKVQYKTPVVPSPCLVLLLDGAIPEGMSVKDYKVQMVQYLLDLMKYNNAATAITTLKFVKKGTELAQLVVTFGLDARLAVRMLDSLQAAGVRAGFGPPIDDYKPNATFAVTDYKLTLNGGQGITAEQLLVLINPFRESNTVDIAMIEGYERGVFYAPVKRPEAVYAIIWNPYCSFILQLELFTRFGVLITMAECPHFFLQKGVPYHIQKQQIEMEKAKLLLARQQRGDLEGAFDDGHPYESGLGAGTGVAAGASRDGEDGDGSDADSAFNDEDRDEGGAGRNKKDGMPTWATDASDAVNIFADDNLFGLGGIGSKMSSFLDPHAKESASGTQGASSSSAGATPATSGLLFVDEATSVMSRLLDTATATATKSDEKKKVQPAAPTTAASPPQPGQQQQQRGIGRDEHLPVPRSQQQQASYRGNYLQPPPPPQQDSQRQQHQEHQQQQQGTRPYGYEEPHTGAPHREPLPQPTPEELANLPQLVSDHDEDDEDDNAYGTNPSNRTGDPRLVGPGPHGSSGVGGGSRRPDSRPPPPGQPSWPQEPQQQQQQPPQGNALTSGVTGQEPETFLSWNMAAPSNATATPSSSSAALPPSAGAMGNSSQSYGDGFGKPQQQQQQQQQPPPGQYDGQFYYPEEGPWGGAAAQEQVDPNGHGYAHQPQQRYSPGGGHAGPYAPQGQGYDYNYGGDTQQQQQQQQQQGGYDMSNEYGRGRAPALPMSMEEADKLVASVQDRVRNAFPSLHIVDPADGDAITDMFFVTGEHEANSSNAGGDAADTIPAVSVAPAAAKVPIPTTEIDELTDLLEAEYKRVKALLECYEAPLQGARARLAFTLMVSLPLREQRRDWELYTEQSGSDEDDGDNSKNNIINNNNNNNNDNKQLPALLPYLLTTHEGSELGAMLATFYPQEFTILFTRYCLPFLLDNDVVQWVGRAALRADPSPYNALVTRVLQHWAPLAKWLNAFILVQAQLEDSKDGTAVAAGGAAGGGVGNGASVKRLVSQLGNTMDLLLSGLSGPQKMTAAGASRSSGAVCLFVQDLLAGDTSEAGSGNAGALSTQLWGVDGAARRTQLCLYLGADIIDGAELAAALFTENNGSSSSSRGSVRAIARDSFYFLHVALSKSLLNPSLNVQTAAFCGRYLQYMEVAATAAASHSKSSTQNETGSQEAVLGEKDGEQLLDAALQRLYYADAYAALRNAYLTVMPSSSPKRFPAVWARLSIEVPPFPLSLRPQHQYQYHQQQQQQGYYYDPASIPPPPQQQQQQAYYPMQGGSVNYGAEGYYSYGDGYQGQVHSAYGGYNVYPGAAGGSGFPDPNNTNLNSGGLLGDAEAHAPAQPQDPYTAKWMPVWTAALRAYPVSGDPFTPLPTNWTASLSRAFGQYYFKPASGAGSPSYTHPTDKTTFYVSPQTFVKAEVYQSAVQRDVTAIANEHRKAFDAALPDLTQAEVDEWLADQRKRNVYLDLAVLEKLAITYKVTTVNYGSSHASSSSTAAGGGLKRARSPISASDAAPTAAQLTSRLSRLKNYPAKGAPFPDLVRGWSANISSSTGLYVFRPPAGKHNSSKGQGNESEAQENHSGTKRRYRVSPQEFVRHRSIAYEAIAKAAGVDLVEVREWMTDQRYRSWKMDAAVVALAKINYVFREELDTERSGHGGGGGGGGGDRRKNGGGRRLD